MSLFAENIKNHDELNQWCQQLGIKFNSSLTIKDTVDRGIGVFYNNKENTQSSADNIELLRIPQLSSFNIYTLRTLVGEKFGEEDSKITKTCLNIVFKNYGVSESIIIIGYFVSFLLICKKKEERSIESNIWLKNIETYLDILLNTTVGNLYSDQQNILEDALIIIPGNALLRNSIIDIIGTKWIDVVNEINDEFEEFKDIKIEEVLQIVSAVRSRVLEIPRGVEKKQEKDANEDDAEEGDDYYVDVTLVPILDFVNHDNHYKNAHFDVDRETNDVILFLDNKTLEGEGNQEIEVFISYDIYEDLHAMFINYGFVPKSENISKVIDIPIIGYIGNDDVNSQLSDYEATRRLYLLRQTPNIQFKIDFGSQGEIRRCKIIDEEFYSYLIFKEDLDWDTLEAEEEEREREQEENGVENISLELDFARGFEQCYDIVDRMSEEQIEKLKMALSDYVVTFCKHFYARIEQFVAIIHEYELPHGETTNVAKLLEFYKHLALFLETQGEAAMWGVPDADDSEETRWESDVICLRLVPAYNFGAAAAGVEIGELEI